MAHPVDCAVRYINKRIEMSCRAIQKVSAFLSFTRNTDIKIRAFIRLMYIRGFAAVNNHDVALYMIRTWDQHILDLQ